jgi:hypothetical protein
VQKMSQKTDGCVFLFVYSGAALESLPTGKAVKQVGKTLGLEGKLRPATHTLCIATSIMPWEVYYQSRCILLSTDKAWDDYIQQQEGACVR